MLEVPEHFEVTCESLNCNTTLNKHQFRYLIHSVAHWSSRRLINNSFFKLQYNSEYKYQRWVNHLSNTALEIYTFHHLINFIVNTFFSNQSVYKEFISSSTNTEKFSRMVKIYLDLLYISSLNRRYVYRCYALSQILQVNLQQYHHPVTNPCDRLGDFQPFDHLDLIREGTRKPGM